MAAKREIRDPYLWEAMISIAAMIVFISLAIVKYETDPQVPILLGVLVTALVGMRVGYRWKDIETGMLNGIANALQAIVILLVIGVLVGVWILTGVVPTLLYYGLELLHPSIFLPATLIICSITSLATGSSWGTTGTIGIALIGVGKGLGFPLPIVAGAVLSGSYFGDKMSPLSDTTNMAPGVVGTDLYTHIKHMAFTTSVSYGLTLIIEIVLGFFYGGGEGNFETVKQILQGLNAQFTINPILLIPPALVIFLAFRKIPAVPGIAVGILSAGVLGVFFQKIGFGDLLSAAYKKMGLAPQNLSRAVEDSATVTGNLIPWNSGGAYQATTLGVPTLAYLPFNFFCWLSPIVSTLYGWFNITITRIDDEELTDEAAGQDAASA